MSFDIEILGFYTWIKIIIIYNLNNMLWVPVLSIIVFLMLFIPSVIFGFFKGWKASVVIASSFMIITFIWIGLGYAFYHVFIWSLYKNFILSRVIDNSINVNDLNSLSHLYRLRAVLIWSGFLTPLTYLITWGVFKTFRLKLLKHLGPKTQKTSNSERKILIKKNPLTSKLIGGGVIGFSSLFVSSFAASAVNALFTPKKNANGFNEFNNTLEKIYSFGLAQNNSAPWFVDEFLSKADAKTMKTIDNLTNFENINNTEYQQPKQDSIQFIKDKRKLFNLIYTSKEATEAVLNAAFKNSDKKINPLLMDANFVGNGIDSVGNQIGYKIKGASERFLSRTKFISQYKNWLQSNHAKLDLPDFVKDIYTKGLEGKMTNFKDTPFYQNYESVKKVKEDDSTKLDEKIKQKNLIITKRKSNIEKRDKLDRELKNIISPHWNAPSYSRVKTLHDLEGTEADYEEYIISPAINGSIDKNKISSDSQLQAEYNTETNLIKIEDSKKALKDIADQKVQDKENLFMTYPGQGNLSESSANSFMDSLNSIVQLKKDELNKASTELNDKLIDLRDSINLRDQLNNDIQNIRKEIKNIEKDISDEEQELQIVTSKLNSAFSEKQKAELSLTNAKSDFNTANNDFSKSQKNKISTKAVLEKAIKEMNAAESIWRKTKRDWESASDKSPNKQNLENIYQNKFSLYAKAKDDKKAKQEDYNKSLENYQNVEKSYQDAQNDLHNKEKIADAKSTIYFNINTNKLKLEENLRNNKELKKDKEDSRDNNILELDRTEKNITELNGYNSNPNSIAYSRNQKASAINSYNASVTKQEKFKNPFDYNVNIMRDLRTKQFQADKTFNRAQQNLVDQQNKISSLIFKAESDFKGINSYNKEISTQSKNILTYTHKNPQLKNNSKQADFYDVNGSPKINDDDSIYYMKQKVSADTDKLKNLGIIKNNSEQRFNMLKEDMLKAYREWIGS